MTSLDYRHNLKAEGGKGGETTQHADRDEQSQTLAGDATFCAIRRQAADEQAHGKAAGDVYCEGAPRKGAGAYRAEHVHIEAADQKAQPRSDPSADCNV